MLPVPGADGLGVQVPPRGQGAAGGTGDVGSGSSRRGGSGALALTLCHPCRWHVLRVEPPAEARAWKSALKKPIIINTETDLPR